MAPPHSRFGFYVVVTDDPTNLPLFLGRVRALYEDASPLPGVPFTQPAMSAINVFDKPVVNTSEWLTFAEIHPHFHLDFRAYTAYNNQFMK